MATVAEVATFLNDFAPLSLAAEWDNVGLLLGDPAAEAGPVMTCLTVTPESAAEAVEEKAGLIVTHHPVLLRGVKRLTTATPEGRVLLSLLRAGVAVFSPHTAFDNTAGGINDGLAALLGLESVGPLRPRPPAGTVKVVVFVPDKDLAAVSDALFAAGAGVIGQYRECSYRLAGTGTFYGTEGTQPTVGQKGRREEVREWRLEVACPEARLAAALAALRRAHSYEEPAYDVYPLKPGAATWGEGRVGTLPLPRTLGELAEVVRAGLRTPHVQMAGDAARPLRRVALACGAAGEFLGDAARAGADVFLTGEMRFHDVLAAAAQDLALLLPGHYGTERLGVEQLADRLARQWPGLQVWASRSERDPLTWV